MPEQVTVLNTLLHPLLILFPVGRFHYSLLLDQLQQIIPQNQRVLTRPRLQHVLVITLEPVLQLYRLAINVTILPVSQSLSIGQQQLLGRCQSRHHYVVSPNPSSLLLLHLLFVITCLLLDCLIVL